MAERISGKQIASDVYEELRGKVSDLAGKGVTPSIAAVRVGDDPASEKYVRMKRRDADKVGVASTEHTLSADADPRELEALLDDLNADPGVHGILLQLPLPSGFDENAFLRRIDPAKDVDGLHPTNQGLLMQGRPRYVPCTPAGVQQMLVRSGVELSGADVVVVGRSVLVGRPLSILLSQKAEGADATVTLCHSRTRDIAAHTRRADVLVVAAGRMHMVGPDHVSEGQVVIDVGTNVTDDGKLTGDVDFEAVEPIVRAISPVPGGVGPMTRAMLIANTVRAAEFAAG